MARAPLGKTLLGKLNHILLIRHESGGLIEVGDSRIEGILSRMPPANEQCDRIQSRVSIGAASVVRAIVCLSLEQMTNNGRQSLPRQALRVSQSGWCGPGQAKPQWGNGRSASFALEDSPELPLPGNAGIVIIVTD
ncbi:hypothetical protein An08g07670 [Aspergillus niger]|uniref:Uncharacterized protein n=2 Tax=Aspergillus niger TaxID=5061 RepID=A2QRY8_ASPNC|nr:hypothetical protein An08g07670 [Aspergillus niger]CAL00785.1 hypothetical protein An08g07670 [Aspergillus niger]